MNHTCTYLIKHNRRKIDGPAQVEILIGMPWYRPGYYKVVKTGVKIESQWWDESQKRVRPGHHLAAISNTKISKILSDLQMLEVDAMRAGRYMNPTDIDGYLTRGNATIVILSNLWKKALIKSGISISTQSDLKDTWRIISRWDPDATPDVMNSEWIEKFDGILRKRGLAPNTRWKNHKNLRMVINYAIHLNIWPENIKNPYHSFNFRFQHNPIVALDVDEVRKLEEVELDEPLDYMRDLFLFQCYTGVRVSDLFFNRKDVDSTPDGPVLRREMIKTKRLVVLPLRQLFNGRPEQILNKYGGEFTKITLEHYNFGLKEIGAICGIDKHMHSHLGRHTYGTRLAEMNFSERHLKNLLGVSSSRVVDVYVRMASTSTMAVLRNTKWT